MVAAEAYRRNFQAAPRGALLGDGSAWIWNQHEKWFRNLTPVVDFVHALTYLYVTATVLAASVTERWQLYVDLDDALLARARFAQVIEDHGSSLWNVWNRSPVPASCRRPILARHCGER